MNVDRIQKEQGARLRTARKQAGFRSARRAALENGWAESTVRAHEGGRRRIGQDDAERYAGRYRLLGAKVSGKWILYGDEPAEVPAKIIAGGEADDDVDPASPAYSGNLKIQSPASKGNNAIDLREIDGEISNDLKDVLRLIQELDDAEVGRARTILFAAFPEKVAFLATRNGKGSNSGRDPGARTS